MALVTAIPVKYDSVPVYKGSDKRKVRCRLVLGSAPVHFCPSGYGDTKGGAYSALVSRLKKS